MKLAVWISLGALGILGSVAGCVTDAESLFAGNSNNGAGGSGGEGGSGQSSSSTTSSSSSSGNPSTSSSSSSGVSSSSSSSSSSAGSSSSSSGTTDVTVYCADNECAPGEVCCFNWQNGNLDHCNADANCGVGYAVLSCNGPSDCPGQFCCITRANNVYTGSSCQPSCDGPPSDYIACEGDQSVCPNNLTCQQSNSLGTGYQICR